MSLNIGELVAYVMLDTKGFDKGLDDAGEKLKSGNSGKFKAAALAVGGAVGIAIGAAVFKAMDLQAANAKMAGQLGLSATQAAHFGKIAGQVYSDNWGDSIDSVNDAIVAITRNIGEGNDAWLKDTTETVLAMQDTFGVGADEISRSVAQMLNTGMAKDSTEALDLLTKSFQNGNDRAGDLLDTMDEYGTQFRKLGILGPTVMGLISQGLEGGARDADVVADSFKEFSARALDGSAAAAKGFDLLGVSGSEMTTAIAAGGPAAAQMIDLLLDRLRAIKDPVQRNTAALALFGTKAEDMGNALYSLDPSEATKALGDFTGAAKDMANTVGNTASGNIESFKRRLQTTFVSVVGGQVIPLLTAVTGWFSSHLQPAIEAVTGWFSQNADVVRAVAQALGVYVGVVLTVVAAMKAWAAIQVVVDALLNGNPIGIIVTALGLFVAAVVIAYKKVEWFRNLLNGVWSVMKTGFSVVGAVFSAVWHGVIEPIWHAFAAVVTWVYQNVLQPAFAWIQAKWDELSAKVQEAWQNRIRPALQQFGDAVQRLWQDYGQKLSDWWDEHWPAIAATLKSMWEGTIRPALQGIGQVLGWVWENVLKPVFKWIDEHSPQIGAVIRSMGEVIGNAFRGIGIVVQTVWSIVSSIWNTMKAVWGGVSAAVSGAARGVSSAFSGIGTAASTAWTTLKTAWSTAVAWFTGLKDTVTGALSDAGSWLIDVGKNIINGLVAGIKAAFQSVKNALGGLTSLIPSWKGPASTDAVLLREAGQLIVGGLVGGLESRYGDVRRSLAGLTSEIAGTTLTVTPARGSGYAGARGGDGAAAGMAGAGTYIAKQIHQENHITAGWEARETNSFLDMAAGVA